MIDCDYVARMAEYNAWMNAKVYNAAAALPVTEVVRDRGAFFGSILGTLNHIAVADTIWLKRFARHAPQYSSLAAVPSLPTPASLNGLLFEDLPSLRTYRDMLDDTIIKWASELKNEDLLHILRYTNMQGVAGSKPLGSVLMHFFNHQTHHRGQATTLLFQAGQDIGVTDLIALIPNEQS